MARGRTCRRPRYTRARVPHLAWAFGTVRDMDVAAGASMDGFTAFPKAHAKCGTRAIVQLSERLERPRDMSTLFVSDLHLDAAFPAAITQFESFLRGPARDAEALYILGDLFESWVGTTMTTRSAYGFVSRCVNSLKPASPAMSAMAIAIFSCRRASRSAADAES